MERLTARQQEVLDIIRNFIGLHGYPPTVRELGEVLKMGPRAVHDHLKALERKGYIEREEGLPRAISFPGERTPAISNRVTLSGEFVELPVLGRIALLHRVGVLAVGESALVVVVSAPHRDEAFAAARFGIDSLKRSVPIWKRETWAGGSSWGLEAQHIVDAGAG